MWTPSRGATVQRCCAREYVSERVRGDALALVGAGRVDIVAEDLPELGVVQPVALNADEDRLLGQRHPRGVVGGEERRERGMDRDRSLPAALAFRTRSSRRERSTSSQSSPSSSLRRSPA